MLYRKTSLYQSDSELSVLVNAFLNHLIFYPTPVSLNYLWGFGSLAGLTLGIQILTGFLLAMHYTPHVDYAFDSVEHLMRDVSNGWLLRYTHANGASMFFIAVYIHICRGLFYGSYNKPRRALWFSGILIFFIMILTAFLGYVLPWGQMSLWGATVITSLCSSIPLVGKPILIWFWGAFSVENPTLNRFFSLHYILPFIITALVMVHLILLHVNGSTEPSGGSGKSIDYIPFYPYFYVKDLFGFLIFVTLFSFIVFFAPNALGHPDNYILANPMVTPEHIVPEWYFLSYYAVLRAVPDKFAGVVCMVAAIICLGVIFIFSSTEIKPLDFQPAKKLTAVGLICINAILAWLGQCEAVFPFIQAGQTASILYFGIFFFFLPFFDNMYRVNGQQTISVFTSFSHIFGLHILSQLCEVIVEYFLTTLKDIRSVFKAKTFKYIADNKVHYLHV